MSEINNQIQSGLHNIKVKFTEPMCKSRNDGDCPFIDNPFVCDESTFSDNDACAKCQNLGESSLRMIIRETKDLFFADTDNKTPGYEDCMLRIDNDTIAGTYLKYVEIDGEVVYNILGNTNGNV